MLPLSMRAHRLSALDPIRSRIPDSSPVINGLAVAEEPEWAALLKRSFHILNADGSFILEHTDVNATATAAWPPPVILRRD